MQVGKANYGGGKNTFKVKDGDNVYRILPPLGNLASSGKWSMYYKVEWGYKNSEGQNRPFLDVRQVNFQTKMVEVESAAHLFRENIKAQKEQAVAALKAGTGSQEAVKNAVENIKRYNQDAKHYLNVVNLNGEIGLFKVGHKAMLALRSEIDKLRKQGVDPLSLENGRFFNFHRSCPTGNFRDTTYQVTVFNETVQATINGTVQNVQQPKVHAMDDAFISRLGSEAFDLSGMYPEPTAEEVERIVNEGVSAIDDILGFRGSNGGGSSSGSSSSAPTGGTPTGGTTSGSESQAAAATPVATVEPAPESAMAGASIGEPVSEATSETPVASGSDVSDDEFLKSIGAV